LNNDIAVGTLTNLREFADELDRKRDLLRIDKMVDPEYEIAAVVSKLDKNRAVLFECVKGSKFRVLANVLGTRRRIALAINSSEEDGIDERISRAHADPLEPKMIDLNEWNRNTRELSELPIVTHFENDIGSYITSSLVFVKNQVTGSQNLSTHRLLKLSNTSMVIRMVEGRHLHKCFSYAKEHGEDLRVSIVIGAHPAISVAAAYQASFGQDELKIANSLMDGRLKTTNAPISKLQVPTASEILIEGKILSDKTDYDCMVEMLRTYDMKRKQPIFEIDRIYYHSESIYQDILPGFSEHRLLMGLPVESKIRYAVKNIVPASDVYLTEGGCNWLNAVIRIKKTLEGEPKNVILAAFAAHPSLKIAIVVDEDIDLRSPEQVEFAVSTRCQADRDLILIKGAKGSSLDPSSDQENLTTTKLGIDATYSLLKDSERFKVAKIPRLEKTDLSNYL
jgi:UbiD family decarboxylase